VAKPVGPVGDPGALKAEDRAARAAMAVALVSMPFVSARRPSIQLGLLKPLIASHGFPTTTIHLNIDFAAQIGIDLYEALCQHRGALVGDWLFSVAAFGDRAPDPEGSLADDLGPEFDALFAAGDRTQLRTLRDTAVPAYLAHALAAVDWSQFAVVGFTSTFQQSVASFALAAAVKQRWPQVITLFGGANFEGPMGRELVRSIDAVDLAVSGEADLAIGQLLIALSRGEDPALVPGVLARRDGVVVDGGEQPLFDQLDALPVPDYQEYFERAEQLGILARTERRNTQLPYESARGCWWGARKHCTFCGLNGRTMAFRAKRPGRVVAELGRLAERHRTFEFAAVDNILDPAYLDDLMPALAASEATYGLFYEVKADLSRAQVRAMRAAGVWHIQPGIESLSSHVLRLMRKGTRSSTNVNLMRWANHYGIHVTWNILWGFPGETPDDYRDQAALMRNLTHLQPPGGGGRIWMERFSPIFSDREAFPASLVEPDRSYRKVYPANVDLAEVAYFFEYQLDGALPDEDYAEISSALIEWTAAWQQSPRPTLRLWRAPGLIQVDDTRRPGARSITTFRGPLAALYLACFDAARTPADARTRSGVPHGADEVERALDEFVARGLMMRDGNLFLALALPAGAGGNEQLSNEVGPGERPL